MSPTLSAPPGQPGGSTIDARADAARSLTEPFRAEYPFEPNFLELADGTAMHYLDEGPAQAAPILCVHGNPTWSFLFRKVVLAFRGSRRVIAPDHVGCGLSDKPQDYPYTLDRHIENLEQLIVRLDLRDLTLLVHDWGGPIGLGAARLQSERISRVILTNTAAFPSKRIPWRIALCKTPLLGTLAVRGLNAFARAATFMALEKRERMTPAVKRGYLAPYDSYRNRIANLAFVQDIPLGPEHPSYAALERIAGFLPRLAELPVMILWGERDWCFSTEFRREWERRLPAAEVHRAEDAGHYLFEDAIESIVPWMESFLRRHPGA